MVICDTCVFYNISDGVVETQWFTGEELIVTAVTIIELSKTPKLVTEPDKVKAAIRAFSEHCSGIAIEDPNDVALVKLVPGYTMERNRWIPALEGLDYFVNSNLPSNDEQRAYIANSITNYEADFKNSIAQLRSTYHKYQKQFTVEQAKKERTVDVTMQTKQHIIGMLQTFHRKDGKGEINISEQSSGWGDLELFLTAWQEFQKDLFLVDGKGLKPNDWTDIWNMAYVGKNDLYWTNDIYWIKVLKRNPRISKYLHPLAGRRVPQP